jgi:hypothetical protein
MLSHNKLLSVRKSTGGAQRRLKQTSAASLKRKRHHAGVHSITRALLKVYVVEDHGGALRRSLPAIFAGEAFFGIPVDSRSESVDGRPLSVKRILSTSE